MNLPKPSELRDLQRYLTPQELAEINRLVRTPLLWKALPGPQTEAWECDADLILYGGAAGGGKTDLSLGKALTKHQRALILRREYPQLAAMLERATQLYSAYGTSASGDWRLHYAGVDRTVEFGSCQHEIDKEKYQGRPHDLKVFDEAANFLESQVAFIMGWNRSEDPDQKCQTLLCSNPPTSAEGEWLIVWFAPWLDPLHPNPAQPGELRWFAVIAGKQVEVADSRPFVLNGEDPVYDFDPDAFDETDIIRPGSRTFIQAKVTDNPYYVASGYIAKLQALPEPLRSKMLKGSFTAGREDAPRQLIPSAWVMAAQERWNAREKPNRPMDALGVDVARGGKDKTVLSPRYGNWFAEQECHPGTDTPDGPAVAQFIFVARQDSATVNIDVIGVGSSPYDQTKLVIGEYACAMNGSEGSDKLDRSEQLGFVNKRAEWWWTMREALDPDLGEDLALPPDRELLADLCAPRWKMAARGIQVESKEDIIKRIGRSPDKGDSAVYAIASVDRPKWTFGKL